MSNFGDRVRKARIAVGLTQEKLGFACGVSKQSVSDWENGRQFPNFQAWAPLRAALQRSLDDMICGDADSAHSARAIINLTEGRPPDYNVEREDIGRAKDSKELALLLRYRASSAKQQAAWLELMKP